MKMVRVCLIGGSGCGKTCLVHRLSHQKVEMDYFPTYGVEIMSQVLVGDNLIKLLLWDISGSDKFQFMTWSYASNCDIIFLCYESGNSTSYETMISRYQLLDHIIDLKKCCVIALKSDTGSCELGQGFASSRRFPFFQISPATGDGIDRLESWIIKQYSPPKHHEAYCDKCIIL